VRFRTNLRDTKDAVYFLLSIGIGMGTGLQVYRVAVWMTVVMCIVFLLMDRFSIGESPLGEASFLEKKDKKKDKKKKDKHKAAGETGVPVASAASPFDRLAAIADSLRDRGQGIRPPNAAIVLDAVDAEAAVGFVGEALVAHELQGHLVTVAPNADTTTLEYLLRIDGDDLELALVAKEIREQCGTSVRDVRATVIARAREQSDPAAVA
jgi:hypothetical protein